MIENGEACSTDISQAIRCTKTRVLPLPAPANTRRLVRAAATASRCLSFRPSSRLETSIITIKAVQQYKTTVDLSREKNYNSVSREAKFEISICGTNRLSFSAINVLLSIFIQHACIPLRIAPSISVCKLSPICKILLAGIFNLSAAEQYISQYGLERPSEAGFQNKLKIII